MPIHGKGFTTALHSAKNKTQDDRNEASQDWKARLLETYIQNQRSLHSALRRSLPGNLPHKTQIRKPFWRTAKCVP